MVTDEAAASTVPRPLLLLDVDGVLNALPELGSDLAAWDDWQRGSAVAGQSRWPITWSPAVVDRLTAWHQEGRLELRWLTTWGHDANRELRSLLGMPELTVAGSYQDAGLQTGEPSTGTAHAAVAPSAPDPLSGQWWKYDVVARLIRQEPERRLVWVDDELHPYSAFTTWARKQPMLTPIGPDPRSGLTPADLAAIAAVL